MFYYRIIYLILVFNILCYKDLNAYDNINDSWPGWRGSNYGSIELISPPIRWSNHNNIIWRSSIEGEGHSSPISDGNYIYITSSSKNITARIVENVFILLEIYFVLILIYFTIKGYKYKITENKINTVFWGASLSILIWITFILILGDGYFNYDRCNLRVWFVTILIYTLLVIFLFLNLLRNGLKSTHYLLFLIITFPIFLFLIMPSKSHAFRGGLFTTATLTTILALATPFFIHLFLYLQSKLKFYLEGKVTSLINQKVLKRVRFFLVLFFVLFAISILIVDFTSTVTESENVKYNIFIPTTGSIVLIVLTLLLITIYKHTSNNKFVTLTIIIILLNLILFSFVERLFSQFKYLRYHLSNQRIELINDDISLNIGYIIFIVSLFIFGYFFRRKFNIVKANLIIPIVIISLFIIQHFMINNKVIYNRNVLCYDIKTGEVIWKNNMIKDLKYEIHDQNTLATSTPIILDNYLISYFGNCGLICINKRSGKTVWINKNLQFNSFYGVASSPVLFNGNIYLLHGDISEQLITSINCQNGDINWQEKIKSNEIIYRPPLVKKIRNNYYIICISEKNAFVFNAINGKMRISLETGDFGGDPVSSILPDIEDNDIIYVSGRFYSMALNLGKIYDKNFITWKTKSMGANCASPILYKKFLFTISDNGLISCIDKKNGKIIYRKKIPGYYYSSLVRAGKYLYATNLEGQTYVFEIKEHSLAEESINKLDEKIYASHAFIHKRLVIRTFSSLLLIE